jgi:hypothetical protein
MEYRKYIGSSHPISSPVPAEECAGTTGHATEILAIYLLWPRTALLVTAALLSQAAVGRMLNVHPVEIPHVKVAPNLICSY